MSIFKKSVSFDLYLDGTSATCGWFISLLGGSASSQTRNWEIWSVNENRYFIFIWEASLAEFLQKNHLNPMKILSVVFGRGIFACYLFEI